ncbi:MAG: hypothetical protein B7X90_10500 [Novosphingobium sp. 17-62-19]|uniref:hypothetical protein n=1 Tax=Novosphingobium sp. 17-62-19 TaxID=1970406 RepID=UPI000BC937CB|nr:hypothetical protein [Novosphingobium sp. 17-62-19]OZA18952.1 MAG: hypothetical protein B7X90_10500 [Novosphingobium sp. 17-62-19]HQS94985.1 hypothetical protein [Novosphingobium sp.]
MKRTTPILIASLSLALASCAAGENKGNDGHRADIPKATVTGKPVTCLPIQSIRESIVRDDWTIDFRTGANTWYRNSLPRRCNGLGFERAFSYATSLSQLCNVDIITVIVNNAGSGPMNRGSCGLGEFTPVELAK